MKALVRDDNERIYQIENPGDEFPVAAPLYWADVPEDVTPSWTWDGAEAVPPPAPPPPTVAELVTYARRLARDKVQAALGISSDDDEVLVLSEQLRRNAVATARISRLEKGQGRPEDRAELDALEPMANAIEPIDAARDAIIVKVQDGTYTTEADIDTAAEWP